MRDLLINFRLVFKCFETFFSIHLRFWWQEKFNGLNRSHLVNYLAHLINFGFFLSSSYFLPTQSPRKKCPFEGRMEKGWKFFQLRQHHDFCLWGVSNLAALNFLKIFLKYPNPFCCLNCRNFSKLFRCETHNRKCIALDLFIRVQSCKCASDMLIHGEEQNACWIPKEIRKKNSFSNA